MGLEENKEVVRRFVEEIPNKKNSVPVDELLTRGFVLHFPNMPPVQGVKAFKEIPTAILSAFPDLVETIDDLVAERLTRGFVLHFPNMPPVQGVKAFKEIPTAILSAFPDLVETIDDLVAEADHVVERLTLRGTHLGEFMGVPPTGKPV